MKFQAITGTKDILPAESYRWQYVEQSFRDLAARFNFREIRTPVFELTQLFARGIGELTDIVGKEMYTFEDRSGNSLTMKPEMTASVIRAYIQHNLGHQQPVTKLFYLAPMFRQERPQKGRLRQFHQFGLEILGPPGAEADAEIIIATSEFYKTLGIHSYALRVNSVGCRNCRPRYKERLKAYLQPYLESLSAESRKRFDSNPLRILDSKDEEDRRITATAPLQKDNLCPDCAAHFETLQQYLTGAEIKFEIDGRIVRGLDYYTRTAFEFTSSELGAQDALAGGGRYDLLAKELGGDETPGVGVAGGLERLLLVLESGDATGPKEPAPLVFLAAADPESRLWIYKLAQDLRRAGIACESDLIGRSLKAQMREATRQHAPHVVIAGTQERERNEVTLKDMQSGEQKRLSRDELLSMFKSSVVR